MLNNGQKVRLPIKPEDHGRTLADYLGRTPFFRGKDLRAILRGGCFYYGQVPAGEHTILCPHTPLIYHRWPWTEPPLPKEPEKVFENSEILVVDKPAGIPTTPTGLFYNHSLLHVLRKKTNLTTISPLHRLDIGTSGLIAFAKTREDRGFYQKQFQTGRIEKAYQAMVFGKLCGTTRLIDLPLGPSSRIWTKFIHDPGGKPAKTLISEILHWRDYSLLQIIPQSGRTNQIRAHLAALGHPIVGDRKYFGDEHLFLEWLQHRDSQRDLSLLKLPHTALHATVLAFDLRNGLRCRLQSSFQAAEIWKHEIAKIDQAIPQREASCVS